MSEEEYQIFLQHQKRNNCSVNISYEKDLFQRKEGRKERFQGRKEGRKEGKRVLFEKDAETDHTVFVMCIPYVNGEKTENNDSLRFSAVASFLLFFLF